MLGNYKVMHQNVKCSRGGAGGCIAGGCSGHRIVHKIEENKNFLNACHTKTTHWKAFKSCTYNIIPIVAFTNINKIVLNGPQQI